MKPKEKRVSIDNFSVLDNQLIFPLEASLKQGAVCLSVGFLSICSWKMSLGLTYRELAFSIGILSFSV